MMSDWITWYQCPQCGNGESKLNDFEKVGKEEMEDGRKLVHYKCPSCGSTSPREDLYRCFNTWDIHKDLTHIPSNSGQEKK